MFWWETITTCSTSLPQDGALLLGKRKAEPRPSWEHEEMENTSLCLFQIFLGINQMIYHMCVPWKLWDEQWKNDDVLWVCEVI